MPGQDGMVDQNPSRLNVAQNAQAEADALAKIESLAAEIRDDVRRTAGYPRLKIGDLVGMVKNGAEVGTVIGIAVYACGYDDKERRLMYFVRYKAGDGRQVEKWWDEGAVAPC